MQLFDSAGKVSMRTGSIPAQTRITVLLDDIRDAYLELEDVSESRRIQLEQCRDLRQFEVDAEQVMGIASPFRIYKLSLKTCCR